RQRERAVYQYRRNAQDYRTATDATAIRACMEALAQVTGHRVEDLAMDMHLEGDLGLDSIKMVELLALLMQEIPEPLREPLGQGDLLRDMMRLPPVEELVRAVERILADGAPATPSPSAAPPHMPRSPLRQIIVDAIARVSGHHADELSDELCLEA